MKKVELFLKICYLGIGVYRIVAGYLNYFKSRKKKEKLIIENSRVEAKYIILLYLTDLTLLLYLLFSSLL